MIKKIAFLKLFALTGIMAVINSCQQPTTTQNNTVKEEISPGITKAVCVLYPTEGNHVNGIITFTKNDSGILVVADIEGLSAGKHGFHVHEYGDCSGMDGKSTGGHFNPDEKNHGAPSDLNRHVGDLGNIVADEEGNAHLELLDTVIKLNGKNSIIGRGIIVHSGEDDLKTQPTGNAGARVACGVIGIAK